MSSTRRIAAACNSEPGTRPAKQSTHAGKTVACDGHPHSRVPMNLWRVKESRELRVSNVLVSFLTAYNLSKSASQRGLMHWYHLHLTALTCLPVSSAMFWKVNVEVVSLCICMSMSSSSFVQLLIFFSSCNPLSSSGPVFFEASDGPPFSAPFPTCSSVLLVPTAFAPADMAAFDGISSSFGGIFISVAAEFRVGGACGGVAVTT
mmetsp:Transcript_2771/g.9976  ORF Transcript_2771/g.9976 Transcript_2771/m.9976 type:complete len:205 (-) Transcript_2771:225-839(-)